MSVINNVLKGLESRESQFTPINIPALEQGPAEVNNKRPLFFAGLVLLVLLIAGGYYWQQQSEFGEVPQLNKAQDPQRNTQLPSAVAELSVAEVPPPAPETVLMLAPEAQPEVAAVAEPLPGNQIVGLQIRETETEMRLEFVLLERAVAYLNERAENSFSYHLRDIDSQIVAPVISDSPWIRKLTILQNGSGVDVNFATTTDILVETRQSEQDGQSLWVINLRATKPAPAVVTAPVQNSGVVPSATAAVGSTNPGVEPVTNQPTNPVKLEIKSTNAVTQTTNQLDYAVELMKSRRNEDAETLLHGLLDGTHDYSARKHLLALYSRMNRPARLRSVLQSSMLEYPQDPFFKTEHARSLFAAGAYSDVIAQFAGESELDANQQALLAASYQRLDQHEAAIRHYQLALQQDATNARNWVGLGISQEQNAAFDAALDAYQKADQLGGLNARLQAFVERRSDELRQVLN